MGRKVLISPYSLVNVDDDEEVIHVNLNQKQIEDCPPLDSDKPVSRQFEDSFYDYYSLPKYWHGRMMWGAWPYLIREQQVYKEQVAKEQVAKEEDKWDPHLRSTKSVTGYAIHASDGNIGHVDDFIIDDETWAIRYLVIDTKMLWGGKKVLISPHWIDRITFDKRWVVIDVPQELIEKAPEYNDDMLLTRDYEDKLHTHYNQKGYWIDDSENK